MNPVSKKYCFKGRVQGVGFRWTTATIAREFAVTGYVMNLPTGDVEMVAEGDNAEIERFVARLRHEMSANIKTVDCADHPTQGYAAFEIKR